MSAELERELSAAFANQRVGVVVGAGVSAATAGLPGWSALIEAGFKYAQDVGVLDPAGAQAGQLALREGRFPDAASRLKQALGAPAGEYSRWLEHTFRLGRDRVRHHALIDAVVDLPYALLATTNFDHLLTLHHPDALLPVTWADAPGMQSAARDGSRILHLHGSYDVPPSVVLGIDNYEDLATSSAYEAVMRSLWIDRVLVFVGCSFDGLSDPDFRRLITWASRAFHGTPHKHFALLQTGTFTIDDVRQYLNEWRIQIVPYGEMHADLPVTLQRINPDRKRAYALRIQRAHDLLSGAGSESARLADLLASLRSGSGAPEARAEVQARADQLLTRQAGTSARLRGDLALLQKQAAAMVSPADVQHQWERWSDGDVETADDAFLETVLRASGAVYLFPNTLLQELHRRGVQVHEAVVSDYARQFVDLIAKPGSFYRTDRYTIENAARVLASFTAIVECEPDRVFPLRAPGTTLERPFDRLLTVCRANRLELRDVSGSVEAFLPAFSPIKQASAHELAGNRVIVLADRHGVSAWDPVRTTTPSAEFQVDGAFGIMDVDHRQSPSGLSSVVSTIDGPVFLLRDLQQTALITDPAGAINDVVMLGDDLVFGRGDHGVRVRRYRGGQWADAFLMDDLDAMLSRLPVLKQRWKNRIAVENEERRRYPLGEWHGDDGRYQHPRLGRLVIDGQELLALNVTIPFQDANDQVVLVFDATGPELRLRGSAYRDGREDRGTIFDVSAAVAPGGVTRLITARLSHFDLSYDQLVVLRATPTSDGLAFLRELAFGRTRDDLISVAMIGDDAGFAADDSGGLFRFSLDHQTFEELERDSTSRIQSVRLVSW